VGGRPVGPDVGTGDGTRLETRVAFMSDHT